MGQDQRVIQHRQTPKGGGFDFWAELTCYCEIGVTVLRKCCLKFREIFRQISSGPSLRLSFYDCRLMQLVLALVHVGAQEDRLSSDVRLES